MEGDDWSGVIDSQTQQTLEGMGPSNTLADMAVKDLDRVLILLDVQDARLRLCSVIMQVGRVVKIVHGSIWSCNHKAVEAHRSVPT